MDRVKEIQQAYAFTPLSAFLGEQAPSTAPEVDFPEWREGDQFDVGFFDVFDFMLTLVQPVPEEQELFEQFTKFGLGTDEPLEIGSFSPETSEALAAGVREGFAEIGTLIAQYGDDPTASARIFGTRDFLRDSTEKYYGHEDLS